MIIGIGGWERCLKTGIAAILATHPEEFNIPGFQEYHIKKGFGNLHLFKTPYPWEYQKNRDLVNTIRHFAENKITNTLFLIDEADKVYNPRNYTSQEQTKNLQDIGQHAKMGDVIIYTYQKGQPDDVLLGVDKYLRSNTRIEIEMRYFNILSDCALLRLMSYLTPDFEPIDLEIKNVSKYYSYWDTKEPVV